jgi:hypothetical protein
MVLTCGHVTPSGMCRRRAGVARRAPLTARVNRPEKAHRRLLTCRTAATWRRATNLARRSRQARRSRPHGRCALVPHSVWPATSPRERGRPRRGRPPRRRRGSGRWDGAIARGCGWRGTGCHRAALTPQGSFDLRIVSHPGTGMATDRKTAKPYGAGQSGHSNFGCLDVRWATPTLGEGLRGELRRGLIDRFAAPRERATR